MIRSLFAHQIWWGRLNNKGECDVLQQCTNCNVILAGQIFMKFHVDIIFEPESYMIIQLYSPSGATFPDCFSGFSNLVAVATVCQYPSYRFARSTVFLPSWASIRPYY